MLHTICMHIRPEAYVEKQHVSTTFLDDIEKQLGRKLTDEEKAEIGGESPTVDVEEDLDTIERI